MSPTLLSGPAARLLAALALCSLTVPAHAQDEAADMVREATSARAFVVIASTRDYAAALATAREAHKRLALPLNLRGLKPHAATGLTFSRADCGEEYPC